MHYQKLSDDWLGEASEVISGRAEAAGQRQRERLSNIRKSNIHSLSIVCTAGMRVAEVRQFWKLDVALEAVGVPLHINGTRVVDAEIARIDQAGKALGKQAALEFTQDPLPKNEWWFVTWVNFRSPQISPYLSTGYAEDSATGIGILRLPLATRAGKQLSGKVQVIGDWAGVLLPGPFIITWDMPKP